MHCHRGRAFPDIGTFAREQQGAGLRRSVGALHAETHCAFHGGSAPQVLAKARENLALAADHNRSNVQRLADAAEGEQVRLQESSTLMDRAGLTAKTSVEVDVGLKPYEEVLAGVAKITRTQHDALMAGLPAAGGIGTATTRPVLRHRACRTETRAPHHF